MTSGKLKGKMVRCLCIVMMGLMFAAVAPGPADALSTLPKPSGKVILSVTGAIERTNVDGRADLDRTMLESIGMVELETKTPFTKGSTVFRGILARDLLRHLGATGEQIEAAAIDLYKVNIPLEDFQRYDVLIALEADGKKLRVRDHGPAWVIYPWSQHEELAKEIYSRRSIWQMNSIDVQ
ncbi:MAG: molybdopterin-dependent oxidoreductase [Geminicoccaceae bacterium]